MKPICLRKIAIFLFVTLLSACAPPDIAPDTISVLVHFDEQSKSVSIPEGSTARDAYENLAISLDILDESDPPFYKVLKEGEEIFLTRVIEEFVVQQEVIPFSSKELRNESLPEGERRLIQPGSNGLQEITTRKVFKNGIEYSSTIIKSVVLEAPIDEVVMLGSQAPFSSVIIDGKLAYISGGNAWVMEGNTGYRQPIVTSGDLDGFIFQLSADAEWLLYTRHSNEDDLINELWVSNLDDPLNKSFFLKVTNVIHFAAWDPESNLRVMASTAEPSPTSPGWQANNNLVIVDFNEAGWVSEPYTVVDGSSGGIYGWWGTNFRWSPDGENLVYARPDGIGFVNFETDTLTPVYEVTPLLTGSDWAWVPDVSWSPDNNYLYLVSHGNQLGLSSQEESQVFNLTVFPLLAGPVVDLVAEVGMFANPVPSPMIATSIENKSYKIAFLKAIIPNQSRNSGYRLSVMDRDGSNMRVIFPPDGAQGLVPHQFVWAPIGQNDYNFQVALIYQGNLWLIDTTSGQSQQLTGDGLISSIDWK